MKDQEIGELIAARLAQAREALEDAKFLLDAQRSPQSIINRPYYAMFYAALALLQEIGKAPSKHVGVISLFDTEFVIKGIFSKELSRYFHQAFELRQESDYKVMIAYSPDKAQDICERASRFLETVGKYLQPEAAEST
ncbi:MAG: HEPN domain-containing protein [Desulfomonilaceae bacterium]